MTCTAGFDWPTNSGLCVSGGIPALPLDPGAADYEDNWGIMVGTNVSEFSGCSLGGSYQRVRFSISGSPQADLRAVVHLRGDADQTLYCAAVRSDRWLAFTAFNTRCWDATGSFLTLDDVPLIDKLGIQVVAGPEGILVSDLCLGALFVE
jgi:hypothetical protein